MIKIQVKTKANAIVSISVNGHADSAPYGEDLVCAGVSLACVGIANQLAKMGCVDNNSVAIDLGEGLFKVKVNQSRHDIQLVLETFETMMKTIEESYHQYIQIMKMEV